MSESEPMGNSNGYVRAHKKGTWLGGDLTKDKLLTKEQLSVGSPVIRFSLLLPPAELMCRQGKSKKKLRERIKKMSIRSVKELANRKVKCEFAEYHFVKNRPSKSENDVRP